MSSTQNMSNIDMPMPSSSSYSKKHHLSLTMPSMSKSKSGRYSSKRPTSLFLSNLPVLVEEGDATVPPTNNSIPLPEPNSSRRVMNVQFIPEESEMELGDKTCLPRTPYPLSREQERMRIQFAHA
ncbi:hypothetical protein BGZ94_010168 [Podila epigama]|nr:hypothetical protein BGZ94_010168 [Podila epigama]